MKKSIFISLLLVSQLCVAQRSYVDVMNDYQRVYINTHEVVKGEDRKHLHFFAPDSTYKIVADFEKIDDKIGFKMPTSAKTIQQYYRYGKITFKIKDTACLLTIYKSKDVVLTNDDEEYLFIPFTDASNGPETYEGGRYIDILITDIASDKVMIDFNKAYNPYCCYKADYYQCPIPPRENDLKVSINAGEKKYSKPIH